MPGVYRVKGMSENEWWNTVNHQVPGLFDMSLKWWKENGQTLKLYKERVMEATFVAWTPCTEKDISVFFKSMEGVFLNVLWIRLPDLNDPGKWKFTRDYYVMPVSFWEPKTESKDKPIDADPTSLELFGQSYDWSKVWEIVKWPMFALAGFLIYKNVKGVKHARF